MINRQVQGRFTAMRFAAIALVPIIALLLSQPMAQDNPITPTPANQTAIMPTLTVTPFSITPTYTYLGFEIIPTPLPSHPTTLNGLAYNEFILLPFDVAANMQRIFAAGQRLGRNPAVFTRLGDSIIEYPVFLTRFDIGPYNLGEYYYLQRVIDAYAGSFDHDSVAVGRGLHSWSVFDPIWASNNLCLADEHMLACEFRRENPSLIFVRLGGNDQSTPEMIITSFRQIIEYCIANGVIPILETQADKDEVSPNNTLIRALAAEYSVPLWDFNRLAATLPGHGLDIDSVHLTAFFSHDWTQPEGFTTGHGLHNLGALIVLDEIHQILHR